MATVVSKNVVFAGAIILAALVSSVSTGVIGDTSAYSVMYLTTSDSSDTTNSDLMASIDDITPEEKGATQTGPGGAS